MNNELIISQANYASLFAGERDVITHQPYHIGDRVVRCQRCRAVIKTEFVDTGCPLCGASPFIPAQFNNIASRTTCGHSSVVAPSRHYRTNRSKSSLITLLILAVSASTIPFQIDGALPFLSEAMFDMELSSAFIAVVIVSALTALVIACRSDTVNYWKHKRSGFLIGLLPIISPYLVVALLWLGAFAIGVVIAIAAVALCIALIAGICSGF